MNASQCKKKEEVSYIDSYIVETTSPVHLSPPISKQGVDTACDGQVRVMYPLKSHLSVHLTHDRMRMTSNQLLYYFVAVSVVLTARGDVLHPVGDEGSKTSFTVSLRNKGSHFCGGAILSQRWIMTAAHCFKSTSLSFVNVVAGNQDFKVKNVSVNKRIALVELDGPIKLGANVQPVSVASPGEKMPGLTRCIVGRWGRIKKGGNSRGLLVCPSVSGGGHMVAFGVTSCGEGCDGGRPQSKQRSQGSFTDLTLFATWIEETLRHVNLDADVTDVQ